MLREGSADGFQAPLHCVAYDCPAQAVLRSMLRVHPVPQADGHPVMPLELAGLFHDESTMLTRRALELCLGNDEDVVIEGTLQWDGLVAEYSTALGRAGYDSLTVIDVATPLPVPQERAKTRGWQGRLAGGMGGRFTPPTAIERMYDTNGNSVCSGNARALVVATTKLGVAAVLKSVAHHATGARGNSDPTA